MVKLRDKSQARQNGDEIKSKIVIRNISLMMTGTQE